ncbi:hypothetical protein STCU_07766 [Strigomonas culicis]|uniref:Uncharacterized protein n=1 Tax=Strigomonas culicis TaxID=28005 RepID=S9VJB6_9TRYP|nr:hypothetical protein STCU_07766 [Strigomonas culicis]|eukprot:EPY23315.1 hypothetical protein STCU_07766 [Strigomonas culicis]
MEDGLRREGVDPLAAVTVGVVNTQCTTLEALVEGVLRDAEARPGLGPFRFNAALLHQTVGLVHSARRDRAQAARQLLRALEGRRRWALTYAADPPPAAAVGEPYHISVQHVLDVGGLMPVLSGRCLAALRAPYQQLVKETEVAASEERLRVSAGAVHSGGAAAAALTTVTTLQAPPRVPSSVDAIACATYATNLLQSNEEARAALQRAIGLIDTGARRRLPRTTRQLLRQFAEFCSRHPLPNCKLTPVGLQERLKWSSYLEARDTALALFGSAQQARDAMKEMYLNHNQLRELRSAAVIAQDSADVAAIFFPALPPGWDPARLRQERTSLPHLRCPADAVPRHLWDPAVPNPYPHVMLKCSPQEADPITEDLFADLWRVLMDPAVMGQDMWFLQNTDMYLVLMRCLLHRLDWEAAVHLTTKMLEHSTYTFMVDHELTRIFQEIGDPAGCLAFKVATKLFDGRITRHGQTKREQYHQDQFN